MGETAQLIMDTMKEHAIPLSHCRGQGYDNAASMAESVKALRQKRQKEKNSVAIVSPFGCHTHNLC